MSVLASLSREWDVVIAGAGPAGAAAACRAAGHGLRTLLVDRATFPRAKVCGGCVSPAGMAALSALGVEHRVRRAGAPIASLRLCARGRAAEVALGAGGVAISRSELDVVLANAARAAGAQVLEGVSARLGVAAARGATTDHAGAPAGVDVVGVDGENGWDITLTCAAETVRLSTRCAIGADGLGGTFLPNEPAWRPRIARWSRVGLGAVIPAGDADDHVFAGRGTVVMCCGRHGYVGLVRLADGSIDAAAAIDADALQRAGSPGAAVVAILGEALGVDRNVAAFASAPWKGTPRLTRQRVVEHGPVLVAGDAARYAEPFTGEGITWALRAGMGAADHAAAALRGTARAGDWARTYRRTLAGRQRGSALVAVCLRSPRLVAGIAAGLACLPPLAPALRGLFAGPWRSHPPAGAAS